MSFKENWQNLYFVPYYYFGLDNIPAVKTKIKSIYCSWLHRPLVTVCVWDQNVYLRTVYYIAGSLKLCLQMMPPAALLAHGPHTAALTLITTVYASCGSNLDYIYTVYENNNELSTRYVFLFLLKYLDHTNCLLQICSIITWFNVTVSSVHHNNLIKYYGNWTFLFLTKLFFENFNSYCRNVQLRLIKIVWFCWDLLKVSVWRGTVSCDGSIAKHFVFTNFYSKSRYD